MKRITVSTVFLLLAAVAVVSQALASSQVITLGPNETVTVRCNGNRLRGSRITPKEHRLTCEGSAATPSPTAVSTTIAPTSTPTVRATNTPLPTATSTKVATNTPPPPTATKTATPAPTGTPGPAPNNRIIWQGQPWYLNGVNAAWYNWAGDFGGGPNYGLSGEILNANGTLKMNHPVVQRFGQLPPANMHTVTWWMFQSGKNDVPYQILTDSNGRPTGIHANVYADINAALVLAEHYDLYYSFAVFDRPSHIPNSWLTTYRADMMNALRPMFTQYGNHPRILSWQVFVEPDWDIWDGSANLQTTQTFVRDFATTVHQSGHTLVTVNAAMVDGLPNWKNLGLDYYSTSWYDYMNSNNPVTHNGGGGGWCALCTTNEEIRARYQLDKPLVIGEYYAGPTANYIMPGSNGGPLQRMQAWHNKGFAGVLAWSLFPERNQDGMTIDFNAANQFGAQHGDLGPRR
jgi:hypothetical protein